MENDMVVVHSPKALFTFGDNAISSGSEVNPDIVGNKGANLILMAQAGLPVPAGFVLPTDVCRDFMRNENRLGEDVSQLLEQGIKQVEQITGLQFGGERRPLLVAVRSGSPVSMPGMMDTILNIGLCDKTLPALIRMTGNPRHAWDSYRRLIQAYAEVVFHLPSTPFDQILEDHLRSEEVPQVSELDVASLKSLVRAYQQHVAVHHGSPFPQDPLLQLSGAVAAVFRSWQSERATEYRQLHRLDNLVGTAVTVQTMVFGNMGSTSGSGVGFTRNPATGENDLYLDFLPNAQGEDVVSGRCPVQNLSGLQSRFPNLLGQLRRIKDRLEMLFRDAQDFEFTVQEEELYLLQTRHAKRTDWAAVRIACEQVAEGLIEPMAALDRLRHLTLDSIQRRRLVAAEGCLPVGSGTAASPGVASGEAVFDSVRAVEIAARGGTPILIRTDSSTDDIAGLAAAAGVVTTRGGRTSHAAVVARQLNKVCIVGCRDLLVNDHDRSCRFGDVVIREGNPVSLDGNEGLVYVGTLTVVVEQPTEYVETLARWRASFESKI